MSQKAHSRKAVNPLSCDCEQKEHCVALKRAAVLSKRGFQCPIIPEAMKVRT